MQTKTLSVNPGYPENSFKTDYYNCYWFTVYRKFNLNNCKNGKAKQSNAILFFRCWSEFKVNLKLNLNFILKLNFKWILTGKLRETRLV